MDNVTQVETDEYTLHISALTPPRSLLIEVEEDGEIVEEKVVEPETIKALVDGDMTFSEARKRLDRWDTDTVAELMSDWHPAILGQMLEATDEAFRNRYGSYHPDYHDVLKALH